MKKLLILISAASLILVNTYAFTDTNKHWAKESINYVKEKNLMEGLPDGSFMPDKILTRGEAANIIYKIAKSKDSKYEMNFKDVNVDDWYYMAVKNLVVQGFVKDESYFFPKNPMTRIDFVNLLNNIYEPFSQNRFFTDTENLTKKEKSALNNFSGLFEGYPKEKFMPYKALTRAEAASIFKRIDDLGIKKIGSQNPDSEDLKLAKYKLQQLIYKAGPMEKIPDQVLKKAQNLMGQKNLEQIQSMCFDLENLMKEKEVNEENKTQKENISSYKLTVNVKDEIGNPIKANLSINDLPFINNSSLLNGLYSLSVSDKNYKSETTIIEIKDQDKIVNITLKRKKEDFYKINIIGTGLILNKKGPYKAGTRIEVFLQAPNNFELESFKLNGDEKYIGDENKFTFIINQDTNLVVSWKKNK